jgi:indolepyruvate ferredoxin oxidoreductase, alpha subunit
MQKVLDGKSGEKVLLLSNEAIVRGALESGIGLASTYPGTPSSEIGETFQEIAKDAGVYFEFSTNEKVAAEVAAGAALSGVRSMVFFKHFGLNVACESVFPLAYLGMKAGMVIVVTDDPQGWSSGQSEEDSRLFMRIAHLPLLEPSDAQECKDYIKKAFELSEKFGVPVFLRTTTRVSHMRGVVKLGEIVKGKTKGSFVKDIVYKNWPPQIIETHKELHKKMEKMREASESSSMNTIVNAKSKSPIGIITSGVSFNYAMEVMKNMKLELPILKLGFTYPFPDEMIKSFIKKFKKVIILEELEPITEDHVKMLSREVNPKLKVIGKELFSCAGEYREEMVINAFTKVLGRKYSFDFDAHKKSYQKLIIPKRNPVLCAGCPHRATFYAAKQATKGMDVVFGGDVGCYLLGIHKPFQVEDFIISMGASQGVTHGVRKSTDQKAISFIGDSTFFHSGMPGLLNIVYNNSNPLTIILDNRITAMTGHQPNAGMGMNANGPSKEVSIEEVVKALGVEEIRVIDPLNINLMTSTIRELLNRDKVSVIIAKRECQLLAVKRKTREGIKTAKFEIDQAVCKKAGICLNQLSCPAIYKENGSFKIDKNICTGCAVCAQICPNKAIHAVKQE